MKNLLYRATVSLVTLISASPFLSASDLKEREELKPLSVSSAASSPTLTTVESSSVISTVFSIFKSLSFWGRASSTPAPQEKKEEGQQSPLTQPKLQEVQNTSASLGSPQKTQSPPASLTESIRIPDNFFTDDWASKLTGEDKAVLEANNMSVEDLKNSLRFAATLSENQLAAALSASAPIPLESTPDVSTAASSSSTSPTTIDLKEAPLPPVQVVTEEAPEKEEKNLSSASHNASTQIPDQFKSYLSKYAEKQGRTLEDLMASIIMVSKEPSAMPEQEPQPTMQGPLAKEAPADLRDSRTREEESGTEDSVETHNGSDDDDNNSVSVSEDTGESDSEDENDSTQEEKVGKPTPNVITLPAPNVYNPKDKFLRYITHTDNTLMPVYDGYFYKVKATLEDKTWVHRVFPSKKLVEFYGQNPKAHFNFIEVRNGNNQTLFMSNFN